MGEKWDKFKGDTKGVLRRPIEYLFGLDDYGPALMDSRVEQELRRFRTLLVIQFMFDWFAWWGFWVLSLSSGRTATFWSLTMAVVLGLIFALGILALDCSIVTADTSAQRGKSSLRWRAVLLLFLAALTAVPLEVEITRPGQEAAFLAKEKKAKDGIRASARDQAQAAARGDISDAKDKLVVQEEANKSLREALDKQLAEFKQERATQREALVAENATEIKRLGEQVDQRAMDVSWEADGTSGSGHYGKGPAYEAKLDLLNSAKADLDAHKVLSEKRLVEFDQKTLDESKARESAAVGPAEQGLADMRQRIGTREQELTKELEWIGRVDADEVAKKYGGEWRHSRDFMDRVAEMYAMVVANPWILTLMMMIHMAFVVLNLLILFAKWNSSPALQVYYSEAAQMARALRRRQADDELTEQDTQLIERAERHGFDDPRLSVSQEVREMDDVLVRYRASFLKAWLAFQTAMVDLANQANSKPLEVIRGELLKCWEKIAAKSFLDLLCHMHEYKYKGVALLEWPEDPRPVDTPLNIWEPWKVDAQTLAGLGWKDPVANATTTQKNTLMRKLADARWGLANAVQELEGVKRTLCLERNQHGLPPTLSDIHTALRTIWMDMVRPALEDLQRVEREFREACLDVPADWPRDVVKPPLLNEQLWQPNGSTLQQYYGWKDPTPRLAQATEATIALARIRRLLESEVSLMDAQLARNAFQRPNATLAELQRVLERARFKEFQEKAQLLLSQLAEQEALITGVGQALPEWKPVGFNPTALPEIWRVTEAALRRFGWEGPRPPVTRIVGVEAVPFVARHELRGDGRHPTAAE